MRILGACIFLSFLAGKLQNFKRSIHTEQIHQVFLKKWRMRILSARIFSKSFGGNITPVETDVNK